MKTNKNLTKSINFIQINEFHPNPSKSYNSYKSPLVQPPERPRGASNANEWTSMINDNGRVQTERTSELSPLLWPSPFRWYGSPAWRGPLLARSNHHLGAVRLLCAANPPGAAHSLARSVTWHGPRIFSPSWLNLPTCAKVYVE